MLGYLSERCRLLRGNVEYPYLLYGVKSMEENLPSGGHAK